MTASPDSARKRRRTETRWRSPAGLDDHGHRIHRGAGFDVKDATLIDTPHGTTQFDGQERELSFETTALVLDGPMANTYLGSVAWGCKVNRAGVVSLDPDPISVVRAGAPTSQFMAAAGVWNAARFTDPSTRTVHDTVDLPLTTMDSGTTVATDMTTAALIARIMVVDGQLVGLAAGSDRTNKEFEKRALETALGTRRARVNVTVLGLQDRGSAAVPPEDEVFVRLRGPGGGTSVTAPVPLRVGGSNLFTVRLAPLVPINGPIQVQVLDHDRAGSRSRASDTLVFEQAWASPFAPLTAPGALNGGNYLVTVGLDR